MGIVLDVAVGLVFLYLLLALVATTVQELIATVLKLRAKNLYDALAGMLKGNIGTKPIIVAFYEHPLVKNLCQTAPSFKDGMLVSRGALPSYIPSKTFALALLDVLRGDATVSKVTGVEDVLTKAEATIDKIAGNDDLKRALKVLAEDACDGAEKVNEAAARVSRRVEALFNDRMARASGWYKRQAQWIALVIAAAIAVGTNADTIHVVDRLWEDGTLRASVVANAQAYYDAHPAEAQSADCDAKVAAAAAADAKEANAAPSEMVKSARQLACALNKLPVASFPIGWSWELVKTKSSLERWLIVPLGWLITAFAVSLGSNFWFDVLGKALQLRGGGPKVSPATGRVGQEEGDG